MRSRLFFGDFDHFAALILAAVRADAVRNLGLMAIGAFGQMAGRSESCVRRAEVRRLECRRFGLGMVFLYLAFRLP